jgi:hypothetical protein
MALTEAWLLVKSHPEETQELFRVCRREGAIIRGENSFTRDSPAGDIVSERVRRGFQHTLSGVFMEARLVISRPFRFLSCRDWQVAEALCASAAELIRVDCPPTYELP